MALSDLAGDLCLPRVAAELTASLELLAEEGPPDPEGDFALVGEEAPEPVVDEALAAAYATARLG